MNTNSLPPDIIYDDTSGDLSIAEGENATLWCKATGHPPPRIAWKREDGQPIMLRKNVRDIVKGEFDSILCLVCPDFRSNSCTYTSPSLPNFPLMTL
ncbi:hypothetical protein QE152_g32449 [Popillia japonica]|uniref:Ig-like domain-containing protein n=1 Tax=Popillia japonica TaxID=7064 RepID=A0AAW1IZ00_POPJA